MIRYRGSHLCVFMVLFLLVLCQEAQSASPIFVGANDSVRYYFDRLPAFSIYKDNYFVTGIDPLMPINSENADARLQISFKQRITRSVLPFNTYLFISYTQMATWDIYRESAPFRAFDFNPGIGLGKALIKDGKILGLAVLSIEHQSNGGGEKMSRDMNWIGLYTQLFINRHVSFEAKGIIPFYLEPNNRDVFNYKGFLNLGANYSTLNERIRLSVQYQKTIKSAFSGNLVLEGGYMIDKLYNIFIFAQYYNGYGENLLEYDRHTNAIRIGIALKPDFFSIH